MIKFLLVLLAIVLSALGSYIAGRILLPGMGLTVPDFWAFFWASVVVVGFTIAVTSIGEILKS